MKSAGVPEGAGHPRAGMEPNVIKLSIFRQYRVGRGILDAPCTAEFDSDDGVIRGVDGASRKPRPTNTAQQESKVFLT